MSLVTLKNPTISSKRNMLITILLDQSASMAGHNKYAIAMLNSLIETERSLANDLGYNCGVRLYTFDVHTQRKLDITDINRIDKINDSHPVGHQTRLNDAILFALGDAIVTPPRELFSIGSHIDEKIIIITDGEENNSINTYTAAKSMIAGAINKDKIILACVPPHTSATFNAYYGVPIGNIKEWEGTAASINTLSTNLNNASVYNAPTYRSQGVTRSMTTSYFTPDPSNLNSIVLKKVLSDVSNNFKVFTVKDKSPIQKFVTEQGLKFAIGDGYYELTKPETVQDFKNIIIRENKTGKLYTGDDVKEILGLPSGGTIQLHPNSSNDYKFFVRSTSWNRNLMGGTMFLYRTANS